MGSIIDRISKIVKYLVPQPVKNSVRSMKRKVRRKLLLSEQDRKPFQLDEFRVFLIKELGVQKGDTLIIHSSFGNINAAFSPAELVGCLKEAVGIEGNLLMPFYPSGHAVFWIQNHEFDVNTSRSVMGVLTQAFKESEGVLLSPHPVKAMAVWGRDRDWLVSDHHKSKYPYDEHSPYMRAGTLPKSKSLGLGVEINSFFHACEDRFLKDKLEIYSEKKFPGAINYYGDKKMTMETFLHEPSKVNSIISACDFLKAHRFPTYKLIKKKDAPFYVCDNNDELEFLSKLLPKGITRSSFSKN